MKYKIGDIIIITRNLYFWSLNIGDKYTISNILVAGQDYYEIKGKIGYRYYKTLENVSILDVKTMRRLKLERIFND